MSGAAQGENARKHLYPYAYIGYVVDVKDPKQKHRIKFRIPKVLEPRSAWAYPMTSGGGSPKRGGHVVPAVGSKVVVFFVGGDIEYPVYIGAMWSQPDGGESQAPDAVSDATPEDAHLVQSLQVGRALMTIDERDASRSVAIVDTLSGDGITIDMVKNGITIRGSYAVDIRSTGAINIDAPIVTINGRRVRTGAGMI